MSLQLPGYPEAVDVHIALRLHGGPGVFRGYVLDKAFSPDIGFQEDKPFVNSVLQPVLLGHDLDVLVIGDGAADVLLLKVFLCESY